MRLYKRGPFWWVQAHGKRQSTGCEDRFAAELVALNFERALVIVQALQSDPFLREQVEGFLGSIARKRAYGFVYGLLVGGEIKIGFTANSPRNRIRQLRTSLTNPGELVALIRGTREDEKRLHGEFSAARIRGEWFKAKHPLVAKWIEKSRYTDGTTSKKTLKVSRKGGLP